MQQSSSTYQTVRGALLDTRALYAEKAFDVFLQGSYGNDTNIYAESDVDVVICLNAIMRSDVSALPSAQQDAYHRTFGPAAYRFQEFKDGVTTRLSTAFGVSAVTPGNKAIKIKETDSRRSADVVACYQYRRYSRFVSIDDQVFAPGIIFPTANEGEIINYPKKHSENCTTKHQATKNWFKPTVRILKNMRSRLVRDGVIARETAPSYFIECMLWNVPNGHFGVSYVDTFCNCFNWLWETDRTQWTCAHQQFPLLEHSNVCWPPDECGRFLNGLLALWKEW